MIKLNFRYFIVSGILFTYFGLKGEFILAYNGFALLLAWMSFFIAFSEINNRNSEEG